MCTGCSRQFFNWRSRVVPGNRPFCSAACRIAFKAAKIGARCDGCGAHYLDYRNRIETAVRHYCSRACQVSDRRGERNPNWRGGRIVESPCALCGARAWRFSADKRAGRGVYCSQACAIKARTIHESPIACAREARRRREARERATRSNIGTHTPAQWEDLRRRAKYRCVKCGLKRPLTRDHIIPLSKGGSDLVTNIQPLCHPCNARKNNRVETLL